MTVIDVGGFAIGARNVDSDDIVGTSSNQLCTVRRVREKCWTVGIWKPSFSKTRMIVPK